MSAFGGKADMTVCGSPLSRSLSGVKRTCRFAAHMSAFGPKADIVSGKFLALALSHVTNLLCSEPPGVLLSPPGQLYETA
jgi:hypothetical protein